MRNITKRDRNKKVVLSITLKREREKRKLTIDSLANVLSIPYSTLWDWENLPERGVDDLDRLYVLSEYFEISVSELLYGNDEEKEDLLKEVEELRRKNSEFIFKIEADAISNQLSFDQILELNSQLELENKILKEAQRGNGNS